MLANGAVFLRGRHRREIVKDFKGRVAVVTGAASGIGRAMAIRFAAEGMRVVLVDIDEQVDSLAAELETTGHQVLACRADVADRAAMYDVARSAAATFGGVHVVALNAGVGGLQRTTSLTPEMWDWQLGVNLGGVVNGLIAFLPLLLEATPSAHLVLTASVGGLMGAPYLTPYAMSKAALVSLAESLFFEMQAEGTQLGVSVLCPGPVATAIAEDERHRPAQLPSRHDVDPGLDAARQRLQEFQAGGVRPAEVAERVVDGIRNDRLYIFTDANIAASRLRTRLDAVLEGRNPLPGSQTAPRSGADANRETIKSEESDEPPAER
jgi:NAD(P)-dependent dehydrogenase (short-subunit alcohol dehydrogenase family)